MARIYKSAEKVLVMGKELQTVGPGATVIEIAIRIAMSSWWTRLWTLQEGAFAKELQFQLETSAVSKQSLLLRSQRSDLHSNWSIAKAMTEDALRSISEIARLMQENNLDQGRCLLQSISWRSTSHAEDETICLTTLLKGEAEVQKIQKVPSADPLKAFIIMQRSFPSTLLFVGRDSIGSLEEDGFRWAPKSLIGRHSDMTKYMFRDPNDFHRRPGLKDTTYADEDGLHSEYPGMNSHTEKDFQPDPEEPRMLHFLNQDDGGWCDILLAVPPDSNISWASLSLYSHLAVIFPRPLSMAADDRALNGVLAKVNQERSGELFCHRQCAVRARLHSFSLSGAARSQFVDNKARARNLNVGQRWCVG